MTISRVSSAAARVVGLAPKKVAAPVPVVPPKPVRATQAVVAKPKAIAQAASSKVSALAPAPVYTRAGVDNAAAPAPQNPLSFVTKGGDVTIDILSSDSGYENKIYWSSDNFVTRHYLGIDNQVGSVNLGTLDAGTRIELGIENGVGQFFRAGPAALNSDGYAHATVTSTSVGMHIGFEDLWGGGDKDFNDVIIAVREAPVAPVITVPVPSKETETSKSRSGLADGTNPGQGAGRENSPNTGTLNPNNAPSKTTTSKSTAAKTTTAKKK